MRRALLLLMLLPGTAFAGGFAVSEQDASASGRAGTGIARRETASAVHYNPAALAGIEGPSVAAGVTAVMPSATAALPDGSSPESNLFGVSLPPHVYGAWGAKRFVLAAGFNAPFGGGLSWPEDWRGRFEVTRMSLQVLGGHVSGAWMPSEDLSFGLTLSLLRASVTLEKKRDFVDRESDILLGGSGTGLNAGLGIHWVTPWAPLRERLRVGLTGRLPTPVDMTGRVHFGNVPPALANTLRDQGISTRLTLPGKLGLGAELPLRPEEMPFESLTFFLDTELTFWGSFRSFDVNFDDPSLNVSEARNWSLAPTVRLGAEASFGDTTVRAGLLFDSRTSPADTLSPSSPDSHRFAASLGAGRALGPVHGDLGYMLVGFLPRETEGNAFPAAYSAHAHLVALTLRWANRPEEEKTAPAPVDADLPVPLVAR